jgi:propionyl-CoA carboxylase alpha chain
MVALAAATNRRYLHRAASISGQVPGHGVRIDKAYVVVVKGAAGEHRHIPVTVGWDAAIHVTVGERVYAISAQWSFRDIRVQGSCNGKAFTAQIERQGLWLSIAHNGKRIEAMVLRPRGAELAQLMPYKPPADMSKYLLSPMPGLLVEIAVEVGQAVQAGERVAVIEAMKMENVLSAAQDGMVAEILAHTGESLAVDQAIVRFE